jgi:hypothetical protein
MLLQAKMWSQYREGGKEDPNATAGYVNYPQPTPPPQQMYGNPGLEGTGGTPGLTDILGMLTGQGGPAMGFAGAGLGTGQPSSMYQPPTPPPEQVDVPQYVANKASYQEGVDLQRHIPPQPEQKKADPYEGAKLVRAIDAQNNVDFVWLKRGEKLPEGMKASQDGVKPAMNPSPSTFTPESIKGWRQSVTQADPWGDPALLKKWPPQPTDRETPEEAAAKTEATEKARWKAKGINPLRATAIQQLSLDPDFLDYQQTGNWNAAEKMVQGRMRMLSGPVRTPQAKTTAPTKPAAQKTGWQGPGNYYKGGKPVMVKTEAQWRTLFGNRR